MLDVQPSRSRERPWDRHRRDQGLQPGRPGGLLLPPQGHGVEGRARAGPPATLRRAGSLGLSGRPRRSGRQQAVLTWGAAARRDLPWRRTRDPWAILVSETMLQQTQVATRDPSLRRLPGPGSRPSPRAPRRRPGDVLRLWSGLGYNGRAVRLQPPHGVVIDRARRTLPVDAGRSSERLPGVGPYTARAILAFAFEADAAVVDTNVGPHPGPLARTRRSARPRPRRWPMRPCPPVEAWAWNQSLHGPRRDRVLGSRPGVRRRARCGDSCRWHQAGHPEPDPARAPIHTGSRAVPLRRVGSAGEGTARPGAGPGADDAATLPTVMGWPDDPCPGRERWRLRWWPTAWRSGRPSGSYRLP